MGEKNATALLETLGALRPSAPLRSGNLTILALTSSREIKARYLLMGEAIKRGSLTVTEVSEGGSVPFLKAVNRGPWPVLIFDGEELVGAKQNRILNATILVGVGETMLPVSCVEAGRWSPRSASFASGDYVTHAGLRGKKQQHVKERAGRAARAGALTPDASQACRAEAYMGNQGAVWDDVAECSASLGAQSPTSAMADAYAARGRDLDHLKLAFSKRGEPDAAGRVDEVDLPPVDGMVAAAVFVGGAFVCLDALFPVVRFAELYPKLLRGYALEALAAHPSTRRSVGKPEDPEAYTLRLLAALGEAERQEQPAIDLGVDLRLETAGHSGAGLVWDGNVIQLSVFPKVA